MHVKIDPLNRRGLTYFQKAGFATARTPAPCGLAAVYRWLWSLTIKCATCSFAPTFYNNKKKTQFRSLIWALICQLVSLDCSFYIHRLLTFYIVTLLKTSQVVQWFRVVKIIKFKFLYFFTTVISCHGGMRNNLCKRDQTFIPKTHMGIETMKVSWYYI